MPFVLRCSLALSPSLRRAHRGTQGGETTERGGLGAAEGGSIRTSRRRDRPRQRDLQAVPGAALGHQGPQGLEEVLRAAAIGHHSREVCVRDA